MRKFFLSFVCVLLYVNSFSQSVPFPTDPINSSNLEPWGYQQVGTTWDTSPFLPFIYQSRWLRLMPPNGVTYTTATKTWNFTSPGTKYPLILFFHGLGERGTDNNNQLKHGGERHKNAVKNGVFPGFLVYPQSTSTAEAKALIEKLIATLPVDINRIYVHGLSGGGGQAWEFAINYPTLAAAAFPMSATSDAARDPKMLYTPLRQSQGGLDANPTPTWSQITVDWFNNNGGHLEYFYLPTVGHGTWNTMYNRSDFFSWFLSQQKNKIMVRYNRTENCPEDPIVVDMGFTPGFEAYEWRKDGVLISGQTSHKLIPSEHGIYTGRILNRGVWSDWSNAVEVKQKAPTQTPAIQLTTLQSYVLPDVNGTNTVSLTLPSGYETYTWNKIGAGTIGTTQSVTVNQTGQYQAIVKEFGGCSSIPSPEFNVINALGTPKPDVISNLKVVGLNKTQIRVTWDNVASPATNETGFEIYRSELSTGPYQLVAVNAADVLTYTDSNLSSNTVYWYIVRPFALTGAAAASSPASGVTEDDITPPSAPNLTKAETNSNVSVTLTWTASADDTGVEAYDVYVRKYGNANYTKAYSTTSLSQVVYGLESNALYNFVVKARDGSGNSSTSSNQMTAATYFIGLRYSYYEGSWSTLPNFGSLTPVTTGIINNFSITPRGRDNNFGFVYSGTIEIPTTGTYTFYSASDDGSKLWVNNNLVVNNDGLHGSSPEISGTIYLTAGYYPIKCDYFEATGGQGLVIKWQGPGISKGTIPDARLREGFTMPAAPATPAKPTLVAQSYKSIQVNWTPYTGTGTQIEIYRNLNGSAWSIVATVPASQNSYLDDKLSASSRYYYRTRAINAGGASAYTSSSNVWTPSLPPVPSAPANLSVTATTLNSVSLSWTDNSNNEDNFEIYRAISAAGPFSRIASLGANTTTYIDLDLFPHTTYYYRVLSKNVTGNSATSNTTSTTTLNSVPTVEAVSNRALRYDETLTVNLSASDSDNDLLVFSAQSLPAYAHLYDYGDGNAIIEFTPTISDAGISPIQVSVSDAFGGVANLSFTVNVNSNHTPVIAVQGSLPLSVKESYNTSIGLSATDQDNDPIAWTLENAPSFISASISGNNISVSALPALNDAGTHMFTVVATDVNGARAEQVVSVNVDDYDPNFSLMVNFRKSVETGYSSFAPAPWSNIATNGISIYPYTSPVLTRDDGVPNSGITLTINQAWTGADTGGIVDGTLFPGSVNMSYIYHNSTSPQTLVINGLNKDGKYNLKFFASRDQGASDPIRKTLFIVNGNQVELQGSFNTNNTADFNSITPTTDGKITIGVGRGAGSASAILNALVIEAYFDGNVPPGAPINLQTALNASNKVQLSWTDVSANEAGYEIFRSTDNTNFSKTAEVGIDVAAYLDNSAIYGSTFYYKVRAFNGIGVSNFSNTASITPPNSAPVITPFDPFTISETYMKSLQVTASDPEGQALTFSLEGEPDFVWTEYAGLGKVNVVAEPYEGANGNYSFLLHCDDAGGVRSTATVYLIVTKRGEKEFKVNFTNSASVIAFPWNNFYNASSTAPAGLVLSGLKDNMGNVSTISLALQDTWGGTNNQGVSGTGLYPDGVTSTYFWFSGPTSVNVSIAGLSTTKKYDFTFYSSRIGTGTRNVIFTVGGKSATLNAYGNIDNVAKVTSVSPNSSGVLTLNIARGNDFGYLNAMIIREYIDSGVPTVPSAPSNLSSVLLGKTNATLNWTDGSDNETGFEIWRSVGDNLNYSLVTTTTANAVSYNATGITSGTAYYYKVRAKNESGTSAFTNETSFVGYNYAIPINFNAASATYSSPGWNNLRPVDLDLSVANASYSSLRDESGVVTGAIIRVITPFEADRTNGATTGNNSGIVPDAVMLSNYYMEPASTAVIKFEKLSLLNKYNFSFFASRASGDGVNRITNFTINGTTVTVNALGNTQNLVQIRGVEPDDLGNVTITITTLSGNSLYYGYLNAMYVQAVNNPNGAARVAALAAVNGREEMSEIKAYPNPFVSEVTVELVEELGDEFTVSLINGAGVTVFESSYPEKPSDNQLKLDFAEAASGFYYLRVQDRKGFSQNKRLIKK